MRGSTPDARPCDVTVAIVSLNTRALLAECLQSLLASDGVVLEVHVVDNGSIDGTPLMVADLFPQVRLSCNTANRGFAAACNLAIADGCGRYILLLNPDTEVRQSTIREMVAFMDRRPEVAICGPRILFPDGRFQSCGYAFPTLISEIRQSRRVGRLIRFLVGDEQARPLPQAPFETDWVDGACLMIRGEAVARLGPLDEQYFLYAEELDWCRRARTKGWLVCALPGVEIVHHQGQTSTQMSDFSLGYLIETKLRYYRKHDGLLHAVLTSLVYVAGNLRQMHRTPHQERVKLRATLRWWRSMLVG